MALSRRFSLCSGAVCFWIFPSTNEPLLRKPKTPTLAEMKFTVLAVAAGFLQTSTLVVAKVGAMKGKVSLWMLHATFVVKALSDISVYFSSSISKQENENANEDEDERFRDDGQAEVEDDEDEAEAEGEVEGEEGEERQRGERAVAERSFVLLRY